MKKIILCCYLILLSGCVGGSEFSTGKLVVTSDLDQVKNKTVYYEVTDPSVVTARVNRQIEKALIAKGWRIVPKDKAEYLYTVSTDIEKYQYTTFSVYGNEFGTYGRTRTYTYHFPYVIVTIRDKNKKENVYEGTIKLGEQYDYKNLSYVLSKEKIQNKLFDDFDRSGEIACEFEYNQETMRDEFKDCGLLVYTDRVGNRNILEDLFSSGR